MCSNILVTVQVRMYGIMDCYMELFSVGSTQCGDVSIGRVAVCMEATGIDVSPQLQQLVEHALGPGSPHFHQQSTQSCDHLRCTPLCRIELL